MNFVLWLIKSALFQRITKYPHLVINAIFIVIGKANRKQIVTVSMLVKHRYIIEKLSLSQTFELVARRLINESKKKPKTEHATWACEKPLFLASP